LRALREVTRILFSLLMLNTLRSSSPSAREMPIFVLSEFPLAGVFLEVMVGVFLEVFMSLIHPKYHHLWWYFYEI
jgi:hypothetical protein